MLSIIFVFTVLATVTAGPARRQASCTFPDATDSISLDEPMTVTDSFDGGLARYDRGSGACEGQTETGDADAVFLLEDGASLSNVIIGADQSEGVHCLGSCTLTNIWFEDVCEDAITLKQTSGTSTITGGGALHAEDKVIQHNGAGTVIVDSFCVEDFGKLYRSCGNCDDMYERHSQFKNIIASSGSSLAGINSNYGDTAIFDTDSVSTDDVDSICDTYEGNDDGDEPEKLTSNESNDYCQF